MKLHHSKLFTTLALAALMLGGCAVVRTSEFDPILYNNSIELVRLNRDMYDYCEAGPLNMAIKSRELMIRTESLVKYTDHVSKDVQPVVKQLQEEYTQLNTSFRTRNPSPTYCKAKVETIGVVLSLLVESLGKKPR